MPPSACARHTATRTASALGQVGAWPQPQVDAAAGVDDVGRRRRRRRSGPRASKDSVVPVGVEPRRRGRRRRGAATMASWSPSWSSIDPPAVRVAMRSPVCVQPGPVESSTTQSQPSAARAPAGWHHVALSAAAGSSGTSVHEVDGGVDGRRDVAVGREEQGAPDDQARGRRSGRGPGPTRRRCRPGRPWGRRRAGGRAASWRRARGAISSTTGSFSQVRALVAPRPAAMWIESITESGSRQVLDPVRRRAHRHERLDHGHQAVPREGGHGARRWPRAWERCRARRARCG